MNDISIRPATLADIPAIASIYADAVLHGTASYELEPPTAEEMVVRFEKISTRGLPYLAAELGGKIAGYAYAGPFRERPAYRFIVEDSVYVDPSFKGRGIGRKLLQFVENRARDAVDVEGTVITLLRAW